MLGASVLLKGPVGPMIPLLAGITLAVADKGAPWLRALRPGWGLPLMVAAAAPWFVAIGIATEGRFFEQAVGGDMLSKIGSGEEKHGGPPGFYLLTFGIAAFPGAWIVLCALPTAWRDRLNPPTRFLLAWIVPSWLVFEAVSTKLPHYTLPMYPALMLLGAAWAMDPLRRLPARWWRWFALAALGLAALGLALAAEAAGWFLLREPFGAALLVLPLGAALVWVVARNAARGAWGRAGMLGALLAVPLYAAVLEGVVPRLEPLWIAPGWRRCCRTGRRAWRPAISASPAIPSPRCCSPWAGRPACCAPGRMPPASWPAGRAGWWRSATARNVTSSARLRYWNYRCRRSARSPASTTRAAAGSRSCCSAARRNRNAMIGAT